RIIGFFRINLSNLLRCHDCQHDNLRTHENAPRRAARTERRTVAATTRFTSETPGDTSSNATVSHRSRPDNNLAPCQNSPTSETSRKSESRLARQFSTYQSTSLARLRLTMPLRYATCRARCPVTRKSYRRYGKSTPAATARGREPQNRPLISIS